MPVEPPTHDAAISLLKEEILPDLLAASMVLKTAAEVAQRSDEKRIAVACSDMTVGLNEASERIRGLIAQDRTAASQTAPHMYAKVPWWRTAAFGSIAALLVLVTFGATRAYVRIDQQLTDPRAAQRDAPRRLAQLGNTASPTAPPSSQADPPPTPLPAPAAQLAEAPAQALQDQATPIVQAPETLAAQTPEITVTQAPELPVVQTSWPPIAPMPPEHVVQPSEPAMGQTSAAAVVQTSELLLTHAVVAPTKNDDGGPIRTVGISKYGQDGAHSHLEGAQQLAELPEHAAGRSANGAGPDPRRGG